MSGSAIIDSPIWQRLANTVWQSFGDTSRDIEAEFTSSNGSSSSSVGCLLLDFNMMTEVFSQDPVRRLSSMEAPEVIYEWEETFEAENSVWTAYSTDDCEVMEISLKACRQVTTIYIGSYNTPYVINFAARMQVNSLTQHTRWMRRLPPLTFSASPSAVAAIIAAPFQGSQTLETSVQNVVEGGLEIVTFEDGDACPICLESFDPSIHSARAWKLRECHGHFFHATCITAELTRTGKCAVCSRAYIVQIGNQPANGVMDVQTLPVGVGVTVDGYPAVGTIVIHYQIPSGVQTADHPNPGIQYSGTGRVAFLPDTPEGREVAGLLRVCFDRRLTFTVGRSLTTGLDNSVVWNGVHHKTSPRGGTSHYGWPDSTYFVRVKEELKAKGITRV